MNNAKPGLLRHNLASRLIHWINAVCWLLLLLSGAALLLGKYTIFGQGYSNFVRNLVGGEANLLVLHISLGLFWICAWILYIVTNLPSVRSFFRHTFQILPGDKQWLTRRPFSLLLGKKLTAKLGISTEIPPQGFYNIGQRAFSVVALLGCVVLAVTGVLLWLSAYGWSSRGIPGWLILIHFICACGVAAFLLIHIYMAALVKDERPGLFSMFTGYVSDDYARHHHGLWHKETTENNEQTKPGQ